MEGDENKGKDEEDPRARSVEQKGPNKERRNGI
jgi:hypothetical protein